MRRQIVWQHRSFLDILHVTGFRSGIRTHRAVRPTSPTESEQVSSAVTPLPLFGVLHPLVNLRLLETRQTNAIVLEPNDLLPFPPPPLRPRLSIIKISPWSRGILYRTIMFSVIFWVVPRYVVFNSRSSEQSVPKRRLLNTTRHSHMKMEQKECSETSAIKHHTPLAYEDGTDTVFRNVGY
jgi:hypothetical protein